MAVVIDEVEVETTEPRERGTGPAAPTPQGPTALDPNELEMVLRRRHERLARLWAD